MSPAVMERIIAQAQGYPFFLQLWGAELWDTAHDAGSRNLSMELLAAAERDIHRRLDEEFYTGRVDSLPPAEQDLLRVAAMCPYPPLASADLRNASSRTPGNVNLLLGRLSEHGIVYRTDKGLYEFTAPGFHAYLGRRFGP
ncbi:MAG: hypothetical protein LBG11_06000 [Bifidobacteriaceae bacterium]|nr:hypothetical protein [Bifidobacteriaceae bacterium]